MSSSPAIETRKLCKAYDRAWALRNVDLTIEPGERVALLGPNGAGKTTLLRVLATLAKPTRGSLRVHGLDATRDRQRVRRIVGFTGHTPPLYDDLSALENLEFYASLYGLPRPAERYAPLLEAAGLSHVADTRVRTFSRGMKQRLALVRAVLHDPWILLLDEPETGLDRSALAFLGALVRTELGEGGREPRTVVLSTHNTALATELATRVVVLDSGKISQDLAASQFSGSALAGRSLRPGGSA